MIVRASDRLTEPDETPLEQPTDSADAEVRVPFHADGLAPPRPRLDLRPLARDPLGAFGKATVSTFHGLAALRPDGQGVTLRLRGQPSPRAFADIGEARAAIATAPPYSITQVTLYGHGAPGMLRIDDEVLEASDVARLLAGKLAPDAQVTLYGCNTASVGTNGPGFNPITASFFGLSALTRRLVYFSLPVLTGSGDKATMGALWDADMARDLSGALPGIRVTGFSTYVFPADRLLPGSRNPTPSGYAAALRVTYRDRVALD